jgi:hypothetical protein
MTEPKDTKPRYKTTNWAKYNAVLKARGSLTIWLDKDMRVQWPYQASNTAQDLLVDSTGIKFLGEGEWKRKKHGAEYRRQWRKVHLGIDANTLEIRAIEVSDNSVGETRPCCPSGWARYRLTTRWPASAGTAPTTPRRVTRR